MSLINVQIGNGKDGEFFVSKKILYHTFESLETIAFMLELIALNNIFFSKNKNNWKGEFYRTREQIQEQIPQLSEYQQNKATKELVEKGYLKVEKKLKGNITVNHYTLDAEKLQGLMDENKDFCDDFKQASKSHTSSKNLSTIVKYNTDKKNKKESSFNKEEAHASHGAKKTLRLIKKKGIYPVQKVSPVPVPKINRIQKNTNPDSENQDGMSSNPNKNKVYVPRHKPNVLTLRCYNELVQLGATKHNPEKTSYHKTLDAIYELLNPQKHIPPYCKSKHNIPDEYRVKEWTEDEFIESFKYYMEHDEFKAYRNISDFILAVRFNEKSWSPLIKAHKMMLAASGMEYDGDEKRLFKELERLGCAKDISSRELKKIIRLLDLYCVDYKVNEGLNHLYYGKTVFAFGQFISEKLRQASFKVHFLQSERVMQEFIHEFEERGVLIRNGY